MPRQPSYPRRSGRIFRPDAVFCWTDFVAFEGLSVARELSPHLPGDAAIMGYDNTAFCDLSITWSSSMMLQP
ncbi:LacI family transcriptional regulator [Mesorhizobium sp. B1-1-7]|nr:LacI family transcriptional regulator [Mesorhizobium sp. B1-1-7]